MASYDRPTNSPYGRYACIPRILAVLTALLILCTGDAFAQFQALRDRRSQQEDPFAATTSSTARAAALRGVPWNDMTPEAQRKTYAVLGDYTVYRRLPIRVIQCDVDMYWFLLNHPDVVVSVWEALGVTELGLQENSAGQFRLVDQAGTTGVVEYLHRDPNMVVIHTDGLYNGPLFASTIRGRTILLISSKYTRGPDGKHYVTTQADCFVKIDNAGAEIIARLFQPLVGGVADNNFVQTTGFVADLSKTAEVNALGVERLADLLPNVRPEVRDQLKSLSKQAAQRAVELAAQQQSVSPAAEAVAKTPTGVIGQPAESTNAATDAESAAVMRTTTIAPPHKIAEANAAHFSDADDAPSSGEPTTWVPPTLLDSTGSTTEDEPTSLDSVE